MRAFLVPTDFSPAGLNAAEYAAQLAGQFGARIILFHAYLVPTPISELPYAMANVEDLQKENEEELHRVAEFVRQRYKADTEEVVRIGVASDEIRELAKEKNADLVIMGIKGADGLDKIIGSTTINTIRKSKKPVLVIPHDASFRFIKDIIYATDFDYEARAEQYLPLLKLAKKFGARLHILNVTKQEKVTAEELPGKQAAQSLFEDIDHEFVSYSSDSVTQGISEYLQRQTGQLLAMVAHKHGFLERIFTRSETTAMAYETHIPLLVLQDKE